MNIQNSILETMKQKSDQLEIFEKRKILLKKQYKKRRKLQKMQKLSRRKNRN